MLNGPQAANDPSSDPRMCPRTGRAAGAVENPHPWKAQAKLRNHDPRRNLSEEEGGGSFFLTETAPCLTNDPPVEEGEGRSLTDVADVAVILFNSSVLPFFAHLGKQIPHLPPRQSSVILKRVKNCPRRCAPTLANRWPTASSRALWLAVGWALRFTGAADSFSWTPTPGRLTWPATFSIE